MAYVISKWEVSETGSLTDNNYISIKGRESGFFSWLLAIVGIEPSVTISVGDSSLIFEKGSLEGFEKKVIPIDSVSSAYYGFTKPWKESVAIGIIFFAFVAVPVVIGIAAYDNSRQQQQNLVLILFLLISSPIGTLLFYIFNKKIKLGFVESGGIVSGIEFQPSLIEGKKLSEREANKVVNVIQQLIDNAKKPQVSTRDVVDSLADLNQLYEQKILTTEEYENKRQKLLRGL